MAISPRPAYRVPVFFSCYGCFPANPLRAFFSEVEDVGIVFGLYSAYLLGIPSVRGRRRGGPHA